MTNTKIGTILSKLLQDKNLNVSELARRVKLPQPTIQRIATGICAHPHLSSLEPIAEYFSISVDQLRGLDPIQGIDDITRLPLFDWDQINAWHSGEVSLKSSDKVVTDIQVSPRSFAVKVNDSAMEPIFPKGTTLVLDPSVSPRDKSYVLAL